MRRCMQVDAEMLDRLIDRFRALDIHGDGYLDVGIDVPSKEQVRRMLGTGITRPFSSPVAPAPFP